ncbi:MAG TPA: YdcF family protein [Candidatus Sulfomarinibacteraceae bacterium]|nr:YdcF family protein [Candidatus Sulfomarinibacteraceae bacterium]
MFALLVRVAAGVVLACALLAAFAAFRIWDQGGRDERRIADAIVVLGAAQYDGRPSPVLEARLAHAVDLYEDGIAPIIVVTGGKASGDRTTEAAAARAYVAAHGIPEAAILAEDRGRTTAESLGNVRDLFLEHGVSSAVFVSDRTHMLRVLRIATDEGIEAWGSPATASPTDADARVRLEATAREVVALAAYFFGVGP